MGPEHVQAAPGRNGGDMAHGGQLPVLDPAASELLGRRLLYRQPPRAGGTEDGLGAPGSKAGLKQLPACSRHLGVVQARTGSLHQQAEERVRG